MYPCLLISTSIIFTWFWKGKHILWKTMFQDPLVASVQNPREYLAFQWLPELRVHRMLCSITETTHNSPSMSETRTQSQHVTIQQIHAHACELWIYWIAAWWTVNGGGWVAEVNSKWRDWLSLNEVHMGSSYRNPFNLEELLHVNIHLYIWSSNKYLKHERGRIVNSSLWKAV